MSLRRGWLGLIALILAVSPSPARADESWTDGRQFGLENAAAGNAMPAAMADQAVAALTPGSVLIAQAGGSTEPSAEGWRFSVAPYFWMARTKASLDVGQFSPSTTIKFTDVVPDPRSPGEAWDDVVQDQPVPVLVPS